MKYIGKNHVSVIGNFICTKENRLKRRIIIDKAFMNFSPCELNIFKDGA